MSSDLEVFPFLYCIPFLFPLLPFVSIIGSIRPEMSSAKLSLWPKSGGGKWVNLPSKHISVPDYCVENMKVISKKVIGMHVEVARRACIHWEMRSG